MEVLSCEGLVQPDAEWMNRANCRGMDINLFFGDRGDGMFEAHAACRSCEVKADCLDYAITNGIGYGVWGDMSVRQRRSNPTAEPVISMTARQRIVWLKTHGWFVSEIAGEFNVSERTVWRILRTERGR